jgi:hypothetical protein
MQNTIKLSSRARLSAHTIRDHLTDPSCVNSTDVPWRAEALSAEWLTPILCGGVVDATVNSVQVEDASSGSSVRKRIAVSYNEAGQHVNLKTKFFAKTTPSILTRLTSGPSAGQEAKFFAAVRPEISIETPVHRYSTYDRISGRSIHLFEDLVDTQGAHFCDYKTKFTRQQMHAAIDLLAKVHGRFYDDPKLSTDLSWIPTYEIFFEALAKTGTKIGHDQALIEAQHLIPSSVFKQREQLWPAAVDGLAPHRSDLKTIVHSDVHPGNWYLTGDGDPGLCDWQCIAQGHWARDFAYAMSTMVDSETRRAWDREMLARYLAKLHEAGGPKVAFDEAWSQYGKQLPGALLMWTPTLCHPPTMPDMQPEDVSLEMIRRITTAIDDLGVLQ